MSQKDHCNIRDFCRYNIAIPTITSKVSHRQVENAQREDSPEVAEAEACLELSKSFLDGDGNCKF